jgi:hypothetical protein
MSFAVAGTFNHSFIVDQGSSVLTCEKTCYLLYLMFMNNIPLINTFKRLSKWTESMLCGNEKYKRHLLEREQIETTTIVISSKPVYVYLCLFLCVSQCLCLYL